MIEAEFDDPVECTAVGQQRGQVVRLAYGAGEAVEQEPGHGVGLRQAVADHPDDELVGHKCSRVQVRPGLDAQRRTGAGLEAQQLTGRDPRDSEPSAEQIALRALARARRPQQYQPHVAPSPKSARGIVGSHAAFPR